MGSCGLLFLILFAGAYFSYHRLRSYLRYFQQEEYNNARFRVWLKENRAYDTRGLAVAVVAAIGNLWEWMRSDFGAAPLWLNIFAASGLIVFTLREGDPRKYGKIRLNMTERATRILQLAAALHFLPFLLLWIFAACHQDLSMAGRHLTIMWIVLGALFRFTPHALLSANRALAPLEKKVQQDFLADARRRYRRARPFTVGITGSYGKTSTKSILGQVMELAVGPTYWPPKGINTLMGITRDVRERLHPGYPHAVLEIGAYGIGSIKKVCAEFPIDAAIVTAVGVMHLDRFGSQENIYTAKSELAQAVPESGILVVNGDNPGARRMATDFRRKTTLIYGTMQEAGPLDCYATDMKLVPAGMQFSLHWKDKIYQVVTPLVGSAALSNVLGSFTMACALGADPELVVATLQHLEPVENRLVRSRVGQVTFLHDAYNSNPTGFAQALEVLDAEQGARKILITPGMIELGEIQDRENASVAKAAAPVCDVVIVVGKVNRDALVRGLMEGGFSRDGLRLCDTREEGLAYLQSIQTDGDVILIENDLPDLYEGKVSF